MPKGVGEEAGPMTGPRGQQADGQDPRGHAETAGVTVRPSTTPRAERAGAVAMTPDAFRAAREALGLSQGQLAATLDLRRQTVNRYERGRVPIPRTVEMAMELLRLQGLRRAAE